MHLRELGGARFRCIEFAVLMAAVGTAMGVGLALTGNREGLSAAVPSNVTLHYFDWIAPYLYYLTVESDSPEPRTLLRLAPLGAPNPTMFQGRRTLPPSTLTHNLEQFYSAPQR